VYILNIHLFWAVSLSQFLVYVSYMDYFWRKFAIVYWNNGVSIINVLKRQMENFLSGYL
jgi:hypothetical protein